MTVWCLRLVAVHTVGGVVRQDEGDAVQSLVTEVAPEAVWVVLSLQSPQDFFLDRKLTVMALGERLLQHDSQLHTVTHLLHPPCSQRDRQTSQSERRSSCRPAPPCTAHT